MMVISEKEIEGIFPEILFNLKCYPKLATKKKTEINKLIPIK